MVPFGVVFSFPFRHRNYLGVKPPAARALVPFPVHGGDIEVVCPRPPYAAVQASAQGTACLRTAAESRVRAAQQSPSEYQYERAF